MSPMILPKTMDPASPMVSLTVLNIYNDAFMKWWDLNHGCINISKAFCYWKKVFAGLVIEWVQVTPEKFHLMTRLGLSSVKKRFPQ